MSITKALIIKRIYLLSVNKLKRIISDRKWYHESAPLKVFESRLSDMLVLQDTISKFSIHESSKNEANKQYLIMLVTCFETYIREVFKILIDKDIISVSTISKIKKLKNIRFSIEDLSFIESEDIKMSELISQYINFQNLKEILEVFSLIDIDNRLDAKMKHKDDVMPSMPVKLKSMFKKSYKGIGEPLTKVEGKYLNELHKNFVLHRKTFTRLNIYHEIYNLLATRHKIIHNNIDLTISQEYITLKTLAVYEFIFLMDLIVDDIIKLKKSKI